MPGFAGIKAEENPTIKSWVKSVAKYLEQEKIKNPIIVGHSLGGIMAQWLAADYPLLVSKIIVVDALPCLPSLSNPTFKENKNPDCSMFVNTFDNMNDQQFYQMQKRMMLSMVADTSKVESIVDWGVKSDRRTMAQIYCQLLNTDLREKISTVICPSLILLEPAFKQMNTTIAQQYQNLKGAKLEYGTSGLHFIMYDNKDWYFQQLKSFLN
jgi:pimeloyl-ACP methyl ester carboxylesterase